MKEGESWGRKLVQHTGQVGGQALMMQWSLLRFFVTLPSHSELFYKDMTLAVIKDEINHEILGCCPCSQVKWEWQNNIYDSNFMLVTCKINPSLCSQIKSEFSSSQEPSQMFVFDCQGPTILLLKYPLIIDFLLEK